MKRLESVVASAETACCRASFKAKNFVDEVKGHDLAPPISKRFAKSNSAVGDTIVFRRAVALPKDDLIAQENPGSSQLGRRTRIFAIAARR